MRGLEVRSLVTAEGKLHLSLLDGHVDPPASDEVLVRVEATPINPSDQGLMFGAADLDTGHKETKAAGTTLVADIPRERMPGMAGRVGASLAVGNEGAGLVVEAGASPAARALLGQRVAVFGGGLLAQYRCVKAGQCLALPDDVSYADAASCFVNPLTALGMVETLRIEGHAALVHTAAASNLGLMLARICREDGIGLVAVVRSAEQAATVRDAGASHACDTTSAGFAASLAEAVDATGATLGFDAIGGGTLGGQILGAMEASIARKATQYSRYGSTTHKQLYIYGSLDPSPTIIHRTFGLAWGVGGWLLWPFLNRAGPDRVNELKARVLSGLRTTFQSHYAAELSLADVIEPEMVLNYTRRSTGAKVLVRPHA